MFQKYLTYVNGRFSIMLGIDFNRIVSPVAVSLEYIDRETGDREDDGTEFWISFLCFHLILSWNGELQTNEI